MEPELSWRVTMCIKIHQTITTIHSAGFDDFESPSADGDGNENVEEIVSSFFSRIYSNYRI